MSCVVWLKGTGNKVVKGRAYITLRKNILVNTNFVPHEVSILLVLFVFQLFSEAFLVGAYQDFVDCDAAKPAKSKAETLW